MISVFFLDDIGEETCPVLSSCIRIVIGTEDFLRFSNVRQLERKHTSKFLNGHNVFLTAVVVDLPAIA